MLLDILQKDVRVAREEMIETLERIESEIAVFMVKNQVLYLPVSEINIFNPATDDEAKYTTRYISAYSVTEYGEEKYNLNVYADNAILEDYFVLPFKSIYYADRLEILLSFNSEDISKIDPAKWEKIEAQYDTENF